jgi:hypothetical protein
LQNLRMYSNSKDQGQIKAQQNFKRMHLLCHL